MTGGGDRCCYGWVFSVLAVLAVLAVWPTWCWDPRLPPLDSRFPMGRKVKRHAGAGKSKRPFLPIGRLPHFPQGLCLWALT